MVARSGDSRRHMTGSVTAGIVAIATTPPPSGPDAMNSPSTVSATPSARSTGGVARQTRRTGRLRRCPFMAGP
jgi:hypothetical protein